MFGGFLFVYEWLSGAGAHTQPSNWEVLILEFGMLAVHWGTEWHCALQQTYINRANAEMDNILN